MNEKLIPADRLGELKARFEARTMLRIAEIDNLLSGDTPISRPELERLRAVAHEIRGSAGMFGRPDLSEAAAVLEDAVADLLRDQSAAELLAVDRSNALEGLRAQARAVCREIGKDRA